MDGSNELRQLAHLLRVGADTAREIAQIRTHDAQEICALADQAKSMADRLDAIASRSAVNIEDGRATALPSR